MLVMSSTRSLCVFTVTNIRNMADFSLPVCTVRIWFIILLKIAAAYTFNSIVILLLPSYSPLHGSLMFVQEYTYYILCRIPLGSHQVLSIEINGRSTGTLLSISHLFQWAGRVPSELAHCVHGEATKICFWQHRRGIPFCVKYYTHKQEVL